MQTINYTDKSALNQNSDISDTNKCNAADLNEIKSVVNANASETNTRLDNLGTFSTSEVDTGKVWIDGKPIYSKTYSFNTAIAANTVYTLAHGISNVENIWIDLSNSFWINTSGRSYPMVMTNYNSISNTDTATVYADLTNIGIITIGGWNTSWTKNITINYTKTTD